MESILLLGFDFSMAKLGTPLTITGLVLIVLSIFLVAGAAKLDVAIRDKMRAKKGADEGDAPLDDDPKKDMISNEDGETSLMKHGDGTFNYYMLFKIIGLVMVLVSAVMIVVGMK